MSAPTSVPSTTATSEHTRGSSLSGTGLWFAFGAYGLWGALPLYFLLLAPASAFEIVGARILFSLVFCALLLTVTRGWSAFGRILRQPSLVLTMGVAGALIYVNWQVYVIGATTGHVVETALGYFINPIVTVVLGVLVLKERLRPLQWGAVGVSVCAVVVLALGYGSVPWIALALAFSFGFYGLLKKKVGPRIDAVSGLTLETLWLTPVAIVQLIIVSNVVGLSIGTVSTWHTVAMVSAGIVTVVPLLFFAGAARRLPLTIMGFVQYLAPILQLVVGVVIQGEAMPPERWLGFGLVWFALLLLTIDMLTAARAYRKKSLVLS